MIKCSICDKPLWGKNFVERGAKILCRKCGGLQSTMYNAAQVWGDRFKNGRKIL